MKKIAVILLNPEKISASKKATFLCFLHSLFLKCRFSWGCALLKRPDQASLFFKNTYFVADLLEKALNGASSDPQFKTFVCLSPLKPLNDIANVRAFGPDEIVLFFLHSQVEQNDHPLLIERWIDEEIRSAFKVPIWIIPFFPQQCFLASVSKAEEAPEFIFCLAQAIRDARMQNDFLVNEK